MLTDVSRGAGSADSDGSVAYVCSSRGDGPGADGGASAVMLLDVGFMGVAGSEWCVYQVKTVARVETWR